MLEWLFFIGYICIMIKVVNDGKPELGLLLFFLLLISISIQTCNDEPTPESEQHYQLYGSNN